MNKAFFIILGIILGFAASALSALSIPVVHCDDSDGTTYIDAEEAQPGMFIAYMDVGDVLLLSCPSGKHVRAKFGDHEAYETWERFQFYIDSPDTYTFSDIKADMNSLGFETTIENFDKNSCVCSTDTEVSE